MDSQVQQTSTTTSVQVNSAASGNLLQRSCDCGQHTVGGEECDECKKKKMTLQRSAIGPAPSAMPGGVDEVLRSPGHPLDSATRRYMEPRFGHDFSQVRVHTDAASSESAQALNAFAYTVGHNLVFAAGQYAPHSRAGRELLAHELTHVVQQSRGDAPAGTGWSVSNPDDSLERAADASAARIADPSFHGRGTAPVQPLPSRNTSTIQRRARRRSTSAPRGRARAQRTAVVEDNQTPTSGQMTKTQFLTSLRDELVHTCDAELARGGRSARGCPYILRTIEHYRGRPLAALLRLVRVFGRPPAGADAQGMIHAVSARARVAAQRLVANGSSRVQTKREDPTGATARHDPVAIKSQLGSGRRLDSPVRTQMESSFGRSFADVNVHTGGAASNLASTMGARAFTIGNDIAFAPGQYRPGTLPGDALIAHELAHTVQQKSEAGPFASQTNELELERQADQAAVSALAGQEGAAQSMGAAGPGMHVQRDGVGEVALAIALMTAEVGGEVAVEEGVVVVVSEAAPVAVETLAPVAAETLAPAAAETLAPAAAETLAPAAAETLAPAAAQSTVASSTISATTLATTTVAATTLSSDSPTSSEEDQRRRRCFEMFPTALPCEEEIDIEEQVQDFLLRQGYGYESLGNCRGFASHGEGDIDACNGAPGESWHCDVAPYSDPISRTRKPGGVVSIFSCLCCRRDGGQGVEWRGAHWSPGPSR